MLSDNFELLKLPTQGVAFLHENDVAHRYV